MRLTVKRQYLLKVLTFVSAAIPTKTAESQFMNFLIDIKENQVSIIASDGIITAKGVLHKIEEGEEAIIASEEGCFQTQAKVLLDMIRSFSGPIVTFTMVDTNFVYISDEITEVNLYTKAGEEYPNVDLYIPEDAIGFKASIKDLKNLYDATAFAVATKGPRELFYGINVSARNGRLYFIATDSFRLARLSVLKDDKEKDVDFSFTAPVKALNLLTSLPENEDCTIYFDEERALFSIGDNLISTRLLVGDFPSLERLIPTSFPYSVTIATSDFLSASERVRIISSEDREPSVKLTISRDSGVILSSHSTNYGNSQEVIKNATYVLPEGESLFEIVFKINFAIDAVRALKSDNITFIFTSAVQIFMVKNEDEENVQIITPIRPSSF